VRQLVTHGTGLIVDDPVLGAERIENLGPQVVAEGLTGNNRRDACQQRIAHAAVAALRADRKLRSRQLHGPFEHGLVGDAIDFAGPFGNRYAGAEEMNLTRQTRRVVQQMAYGNFRDPVRELARKTLPNDLRCLVFHPRPAA
jgi:hypothetical protein